MVRRATSEGDAILRHGNTEARSGARNEVRISMKPFSIGLPGAIYKANRGGIIGHARAALLVNSVPLSPRPRSSAFVPGQQEIEFARNPHA